MSNSYSNYLKNNTEKLIVIRGINNQPYFNMEQHLDMAEFERLQPEILAGFALARDHAKEGTWMAPGFTFEQMSYRPHWKPIYEAMNEFMALPDDSPIKQAGLALMPNDFKNFQERIGRVIFFHCDHDGIPFEHRDFDAKNGMNITFPHRNEFIHIRPNTKKAFYLWDPEKKNKVYLNTRAAWWNDQDWHGGERIMEQSYSLRIDGKFTEAFRKTLGIDHLDSY